MRRVRSVGGLVLCAALLGACSSGGRTATPPHGGAPPDTWRPRASLSTPRARHTATLLASGKVLVAGGADTASAEVYDPAGDAWEPTGPMAKVRRGHAAALLPSGRVLVVGGVYDPPTGTYDSSAELYDPATNAWTSLGPTGAVHAQPTATALGSGQVLVVGAAGIPLMREPGVAELFDPGSGAFTATDPIPADRLRQSATLLASGKVLVAGGEWSEDHPTTSATIFDPGAPAGSRWAETGSMATWRLGHPATRLRSGDVLVSGGTTGDPGAYWSTDSVEIYEVGSGAWVDAGRLSTPRSDHTATLLASGRVLFAGGTYTPNPLQGGGPNEVLATVDCYDPATDAWAVVAPMDQARTGHSATLLPGGEVLVVGGMPDPSWLGTSSVEEYTP